MKKKKEKIQVKKRKLTFPGTATFLVMFAAFLVILTYIVPAGEFDRVFDEATGKEIVVADSFHAVESTPVTILQFLESSYQGFLEVADIIGLIFIAGGAIGILVETGAIHAGLSALVRKTGHKDIIIIVLLMIVFALGTSTIGIGEEYIILIPLLVTVFKALGYDALTAVAAVMLAAFAGQGFALTSPFNLVIAQQIAELQPLSGMGLRVIGWLGAVGIAIFATVRHAKRVKNDPAYRIKFREKGGGHRENEGPAESIDFQNYEFTPVRKAMLIILALSLGILVYGILKLSWGYSQMCALFFAMALVCGGIYFKSLDKTMNIFVAQAVLVAPAAMLLAFSRAIMVIMEQGNITDTIVNALSVPLSNAGSIFAAWGIYLVNIVINLFVPSCSGQAVVVMPILTPLADLLGISRQVAVHAFMTADSFGNLIIPTHATLISCLSLAKVSFSSWFKLAWRLCIILTLWAWIILAVGVFINW